YQPAENFNGSDYFSYRADDAGTNLGVASVHLIVVGANDAPVLPAQPDRTISVFATLLVTNTASDVDLPPQTLTYSLLASPANASISADGIISWTPDAGQAATTNLFETVVTDNGQPARSATNSFYVVVNGPPELSVLPDVTVAELTTFTITNGAMDAEQPAN